MKHYKYLKDDIGAGLVVYLVALPLCLGIALASGAPLMAGLISGMVAGLVVSWLSGSEVSVSGPAAGLTVIVASGIVACGSYESFLCAVVIAGIFQILMGYFRAGSLAGLFPNSVIAGMLTAIGIIIVLKQIPHGLGRDTDYEGDLNFFQMMDQEDSISSIFKAFFQIETGVFVVFLLSVLLLLVWNHKKLQQFK